MRLRSTRFTPALAVLAVPAALYSQTIVSAGTLITCSLSEPSFSSSTAELGDPTICDVRPFRQSGRVLAGRGYYLVGRLADFHDPGRFFGKGWIKLEFDRMVISETNDVALSAKVVAARGYKVDADGRIRGKGHPKRDAIGWLFPFLWPVKMVTLPMRGPRPTMKGEVLLTLRLMDDIVVPDRREISVRDDAPKAELKTRSSFERWRPQGYSELKWKPFSYSELK
jgi:hypothetical protein